MVTGANYLLSAGDDKVLVDCGLYQGGYYCEQHNFEPFPYDPASIEAVFVTHAHIDHTGLLPKLFRHGFRGTVYSTPPTKDVARELLLDSEDLLLREAEREGKPPLYSVEDVEGIMSRWRGVEYESPFAVKGFTATFKNLGHIFGSSSIYLEGEGKKIVFSGDLGNYAPPLLQESDMLEPGANYCLIESAYGDRLHEDVGERSDRLEDIIEETVRAKGTLVIPAFAMERTQKLLFVINDLVENGRIPQVPVFVDSPLAIGLTAVYKGNEQYFNKAAKDVLAHDKSLFSFPGLKTTLTAAESRAINDVPSPKIVIAGSGMSQGGRILYHEKRYLPDPKSAVLFIGYQVAGSLGRQILDGAQSVTIFGEEVPVRCRVASIGSYSAHADQRRLLEWLYPGRLSLEKVFVVQGEKKASEALAGKIRDEMAIEAHVPSLGEEIVL